MTNFQIFWLIIFIVLAIYGNICLYVCKYGTKHTSPRWYEARNIYSFGIIIGFITDLIILSVILMNLEHFNNWLDKL